MWAADVKMKYQKQFFFNVEKSVMGCLDLQRTFEWSIMHLGHFYSQFCSGSVPIFTQGKVNISLRAHTDDHALNIE